MNKTIHALCQAVIVASALAAASPTDAASPNPGKPDPKLVGHYYLSGVREVGSELRLQPDGRFRWFMSYGAVDQEAQGRWGRSGHHLTLLADAPAAAGPVFDLRERDAWSERAERALRDHQSEQQAKAVQARCPWLNAAGDVAVSAAPAYARDATAPDKATVDRAESAQAAAVAARDAASLALERATADDAGPAAREAASAAMDRWHAAQHAVQQTHRDAQRPEPYIEGPTTPRCQLPGHVSHVPPEQWQRGIAIAVVDPKLRMGLSRVEATFVYGDGHREQRVTRSGWAAVPLRAGTAVNKLQLSLPDPINESATLEIAPLAEGIQLIAADLQRFQAPAFTALRLQVVDGALIPPNGRGSYTRQ